MVAKKPDVRFARGTGSAQLCAIRASSIAHDLRRFVKCVRGTCLANARRHANPSPSAPSRFFRRRRLQRGVDGPLFVVALVVDIDAAGWR
jgi:hypothetical protein